MPVDEKDQLFDRSLVPLDGSSLAGLALRHGEAPAEVYQAEVMRALERERRSHGAAEDVLAWDLRRVAAEPKEPKEAK